MKRALLIVLCGLAFVSFASPASAVLRPRFPRRAAPPRYSDWFTFGGEDTRRIVHQSPRR
jgi:hypothetical protein